MNLTETPVFLLSQMLRDKKISPPELALAFLDRIKRTDGHIRSFITLTEDNALLDAKKAEELIDKNAGGPLTGIPVALKDLLCTKGVPTTCGSKMLENFVPPYDGACVEKLKKTGAVIIGKTNMDEFAMGSSTENSRFFPTKNPWAPDRVPGGSSGGSAAAVAARQVPLALGTDTGGSIRQPAAFCGITGIKPTYGAVSRYGLIAFASSLDQIGPMATCVKDAALLLNLIAGRDFRDSTSADVEHPDYFQAASNPSVKGLTFGMPIEFFDRDLNPSIGAHLEQARKTFEKLGARFTEVSIPALKYALAAYYVIAPSEASSNLARYDGCRYGYRDPDDTGIEAMYKKTRREGFGGEVLRRIMIGTYCLSSGYYDAYYLKAQKTRTLIKRGFDEAFKKCDLIFAPATPTTAFRHGEKIDNPLEMYLSDIYTVSVNLAGLPAMVFPCGFEESLPVGLQLIGRAFDETTLINAGAAFQETVDYHTEIPGGL